MASAVSSLNVLGSLAAPGAASLGERAGRSRRLWFRHSFIPFIRLFEGTTPPGGVPI
jgi:hypothetical protein